LANSSASAISWASSCWYTSRSSGRMALLIQFWLQVAYAAACAAPAAPQQQCPPGGGGHAQAHV
jgi:hypothetical protein